MAYSYNELGFFSLGGAISESANKTLSDATLSLSRVLFYRILYVLFLIPTLIGKTTIYLMQQFTLKKERTDITLIGYMLIVSMIYYLAITWLIVFALNIHSLIVASIIFVSIPLGYRLLVTLVWPFMRSAKENLSLLYDKMINETLQKDISIEDKMQIVTSYRLMQKLFEKLKIPLLASDSLTKAINYSMLVEIRVGEVENNKGLTGLLEMENEKFSIVLGKYLAEIGG